MSAILQENFCTYVLSFLLMTYVRLLPGYCVLCIPCIIRVEETCSLVYNNLVMFDILLNTFSFLLYLLALVTRWSVGAAGVTSMYNKILMSFYVRHCTFSSINMYFTLFVILVACII